MGALFACTCHAGLVFKPQELLGVKKSLDASRWRRWVLQGRLEFDRRQGIAEATPAVPPLSPPRSSVMSNGSHQPVTYEFTAGAAAPAPAAEHIKPSFAQAAVSRHSAPPTPTAAESVRSVAAPSRPPSPSKASSLYLPLGGLKEKEGLLLVQSARQGQLQWVKRCVHLVNVHAAVDRLFHARFLVQALSSERRCVYDVFGWQ
jgi:hypothetical protein